MRKLLLACGFLLAATSAMAVEGIYGDLFPYENRHSTFTVEVDATKMDRFSIQVVYSTPTIDDSAFSQDQVNIANNTVQVSTGYATGMPILLVNQGSAVPSPLVKGTTYYAVIVADTLMQFATTYAQAVTGDEIDILSASGGGWQVKPLTLNLGSAGYLWYASNDGENWTLTGSSQALTAMGAAGGQRLHDFGEYAYRLLRFTFNGPANGVIKLRAYINGKRRE